MQKQLKDFSVIELKSICYDMLAQIEQNQMTIKAINQELSTRTDEKPAEAPVEPAVESPYVEEKKD